MVFRKFRQIGLTVVMLDRAGFPAVWVDKVRLKSGSGLIVPDDAFAVSCKSVLPWNPLGVFLF